MDIQDLTLRDICASPEDYILSQNNDFVLFLKNGTMLRKVDYDELCRSILEDYELSNLGGANQSVQDALNQVWEAQAVGDQIVRFNEEPRENIISGETIGKMMGKIHTWLQDLKQAAWYDVSDSLNVQVAGTHVLDAHQGFELLKKINANTTSITNNYNTLNGKITTANTDISGLKTRMTAAENKNNSQDTEITALKARVTSVEQKNVTQDTSITTNRNNISALQHRLDYATISINASAAVTTTNARISSSQTVSVGRTSSSDYFAGHNSSNLQIKRAGNYLMIIEGEINRKSSVPEIASNITLRLSADSQIGVGATATDHGGTDNVSHGVVSIGSAQLNQNISLWAYIRATTSLASEVNDRTIVHAKCTLIPLF